MEISLGNLLYSCILEFQASAGSPDTNAKVSGLEILP